MWRSVRDVIAKSVPLTPVWNVCTEAVRPFSDVSPPPAPASDPQLNCPVVELQSNLLLVASEHEESPAPRKVLATVRLVVDAFCA